VPRDPRFPLFDGLRALAVLSVLVFHTNEIAGSHTGWRAAILDQPFGVTIFFVVSGFLLYRPFVAARLGDGRRLPFRDYARRRVLRIVPAYWLALTLLAIYPGLPGVFGSRWWVYYGFGQDYSADTVYNGLAPAWSLGTEVVFYAVLPLYALGLGLPWLCTNRPTIVVAETFILGLLAALAVGLGHSFAARNSYLSRTLVGTFDWFALGMGLAVASAVLANGSHRPRVVSFVERRPSVCWLAAAGVWAVCAVWTRVEPPDPGYDIYAGRLSNVLFGLLALLVVLPAVFGDHRNGLPRRILALPTIAWLGLVSYGIFLWHFPIVLELEQTGSRLGVDRWSLGSTALLGSIALAVTIVCAAFSYYALERYALRAKARPIRLSPPRVRLGRLEAGCLFEDGKRLERAALPGEAGGVLETIGDEPSS
jgi:peptidoglycan/LPS O-acetylase OafA/YrhL